MDLRLKKINSKTLNLYESPISGVFWIMNEEDAKVPLAVHDVLLQIKIIVELCANYLDKGGMVFYVGTRTSSQIAVLDAVEIVPTFGVPEGVFVPVMAGGTEALIRIRTLEHVEDSGEDGAKDIGNFVLTRNDVVMGISTGGRTPYVKGALRRTKELGTKTSIICNNSRIPMAKFVDVVILVRTGRWEYETKSWNSARVSALHDQHDHHGQAWQGLWKPYDLRQRHEQKTSPASSPYCQPDNRGHHGKSSRVFWKRLIAMRGWRYLCRLH